MAHIYTLRDKNSVEPFYVGSTRKGISTRLANHIHLVGIGKHPNKHLTNKVKKIGFDNVVCEVLTMVPDAHQFQCEANIIRAMKDKYKLVNRVHVDINPRLNKTSYVRPMTNQEWADDFVFRLMGKITNLLRVYTMAELRDGMDEWIKKHNGL